jgi:hypothetical protein
VDDEVQFLNWICAHAAEQGHLDLALKAGEAATATGFFLSPVVEALAYLHFAVALITAGRAQWQRHLDRAQELWIERDEHETVEYYSTMATIHEIRGEQQDVLECLSHVATIYERRRVVGGIVDTRCRSAFSQPYLSGALGVLERAQEVANTPALSAKIHWVRARVLVNYNQLERAREELTHAFNLYEQVSDQFCMDQIDEEQRSLIEN